MRVGRLKGIEEPDESVDPVLRLDGSLCLRALLDIRVRVLPSGLGSSALEWRSEVARLLSGPSTLSEVVAAQHAHRRVLVLAESPAWLKVMRQQAELLENFSNQLAFTRVSDALLNSTDAFA